MKTYTITKVSGQPDWDTIPSLEMDVSYRMKLEDIPIRAWTQVAYNEDALLIRQWAKEPVLRAELTSPIDEVCEDSCLEFFFCPMEDDLRYFNIEYTPICNRFLGFGSGIPDLIRLLPDENNDRFLPCVKTFEGGWELTYQIPYEFIRRFFPGFAPAPGKTMRANCCKCGDKTVNFHWLTWSSLTYSDEDFTFHTPSEFGQMIFG